MPPVALPSEPADPEVQPYPGTLLIRNGKIMTAAGPVFNPGFVLIENGRITQVGAGELVEIPADAEVVDAQGGTVTPGVIDTHSHMGVYGMPHVRAHSDGNEMVRNATPELWAEHAFWPQDPALWRAVAGGVTTVQVLPGSANLIGGRTFVAKLRPQSSARLMRFPGARQGLKMACGENPKRVYGESGGPRTRMGNVAGYRSLFQQAQQYARQWDIYRRDLAHWEEQDRDAMEDPPEPPGRNFAMETLAKVLEGEIWVHNHCYRADEMHIMLDLMEEFGFVIRSFHHALSAYKLADRLADTNVAVSTWADWWGFKMEAYDGIPYNAALLAAKGVRTIIHSDDSSEVRRLNQEAAKAMSAGRELGIDISENEALRWITANPAWALGLEEHTGTLEPGKMADVVIWDGPVFSVYTKAQRVFIDGHTVFNRDDPTPRSDFEVGLPDPVGRRPSGVSAAPSAAPFAAPGAAR